jgi:hypothetical protein
MYVLSQWLGFEHGCILEPACGLILFPAPADRAGEITGKIHTRERLGDLLKFYREAAWFF